MTIQWWESVEKLCMVKTSLTQSMMSMKSTYSTPATRRCVTRFVHAALRTFHVDKL